MLEKINYTEKDKETLTKMLEMMLDEGANEHIWITPDPDPAYPPGDCKIKLRRYRLKIDIYDDIN